jgi:hypothetical protein
MSFTTIQKALCGHTDTKKGDENNVELPNEKTKK